MCLLESLLDDAPVDLLGKPIADSDARVLDARGREKNLKTPPVSTPPVSISAETPAASENHRGEPWP